MNDDWERLGEWIVSRRKELRLNQSQLVRRSRLSPRTVQALEAGGVYERGNWHRPNPRPDTIWRLADALEVDGRQLEERIAGIKAGGELKDERPQIAGYGQDPSHLADILQQLRDTIEEQGRMIEEQRRKLERLEGGDDET